MLFVENKVSYDAMTCLSLLGKLTLSAMSALGKLEDVHVSVGVLIAFASRDRLDLLSTGPL